MIEVLFVDDRLTEIEPVARALELRTGLNTVCTNSVEKALEYVRNEHIKVAILDQRMEQVLDLSGTELYRKIRDVDKRVRGIIFSAESEKADVVEANALGLRYLDKGSMPEELAREVLTKRAEYLEQAEQDYDRMAVLIGRYRRRRFRSPGQVIELLTVEDLSDKPEANDLDYVTVYEIGSGQTERQVHTFAIGEEVQIEQESLTELEARLGLGSGLVKDLSTHVKSSLKERNTLTSRSHAEHLREETATLSDVDLHAGVIHRRIEVARLFLRRRALLRVTCECCGDRTVLAINLRQWSGRYHRRQVDIYRNQTRQDYDLGER